MSQGDKTLRMIDGAGLAVIAALSAGVYFAAVQPVLDDRAAQRQQTQELAERQRKATELGVTLSDRRHTLQQTEGQVASRSLKLRPLDQLNQRLAELTYLSDACDLSLDQLEPGAREQGTHYVTVPIQVSGRGSYAATVQFLSQMHESWPDLAVASLELAGNPRSAADQPKFAVQLLWFAAPAP